MLLFKKKLSLFKKVDELATLTGADVGVLLSSPSGKAYSHGSTSIEKIIDKFLKWKLDNPQIDDQADMEKLDVFKAFDDIREELQVGAIGDYQATIGKIKKEAKNSVLIEPLKFDLNVVPELDEGESSELIE
ncbi:hypothetical protein RND71_011681 [Anisodus tanguticus]|uniref:MADS-box domain-containing protein n=1 Tax=Anisodus tanguticus TaxID=243964 RepID=A0AAE1SBS5_9SOLA|nr:hypothetical protein RND71_011681 [Anisodus tanguticus]